MYLIIGRTDRPLVSCATLGKDESTKKILNHSMQYLTAEIKEKNRLYLQLTKYIKNYYLLGILYAKDSNI